MQGPPSGVSLGDWFRAAVLPLPHPNIYQTPSHTIVSIPGALWSAGLAGLLPSFPESSSDTFFWLFSLQSPWAMGRQRNERVCYPIWIVLVKPFTLAQHCICLEQRCLSDCPVGWWAHAQPSLNPVSESSSPPPAALSLYLTLSS